MVVSEVPSSKLLGMTFDRDLTFGDHLKNVSLWGSRRLGFFHKLSKVIDSKLQTAVYNDFARPIMEYSVLIWIGASTSVLSRLCNVHWCALHTIISGCDLQSLEVRCAISALCYRYKLHYYPLPAIVQALLPAAKAPLLADLLTWEQLDASAPSPVFNRKQLYQGFIGTTYCAPFLTACLIRGTISHLVHLNMHLAVKVSRRSNWRPIITSERPSGIGALIAFENTVLWLSITVSLTFLID